MSELSLRSKIIVIGSSLLFLPLLFLGVLVNLRSSFILHEIAMNQFIQTADSMAAMIDVSLEKSFRIVKGLAVDPVIIEEAIAGTKDKTRAKLSEYYSKLYEDYEGFAVYDSNGIIRADGVDEAREGSISIFEREYFVKAKMGECSISSIVTSKISGRPIFVLSCPLFSDTGDFLGGVISVVKAEYLLNYVDSLMLGQTGYAFLIDDKGYLIAHPNEKDYLFSDPRDILGVGDLVEDMLAFKRGGREYTYRNIDKTVGYAEVKISGWILGVAQNKSEILALARSITLYISFFTIVFMFLGFILLIYYSKQISSTIQNRLARLNKAVEQADEAFLIVDSNGKLQFYNKAAARIMDNKAKLNTPFHLKAIDHEKLLTILSEVDKGDVWSEQIQGQRQDGTHYILELTISMFHEKRRKKKSYLAIGRDITSELELQRQFLQSQKQEAIGILAGGIAHDFNNILAAIFAFNDLALLIVEDGSKIHSYLQEIRIASLRGKDLVEHILTFSRNSDAGLKPLVLKNMIKDTLKLIRASLPSTIEIEDKMESSALVFADPSQIHQLVMNLCTNAGHAMKENGGILHLSLVEVRGASLKKGFPEAVDATTYLRLDVKDTGTGIRQEIQNSLYDPFFTTKPVGEGTGLGLSVVHGIVKGLKGYITLESEIGEGSTFSVYLPTIDMDVQAAEESLNVNYSQGTGHILLIDDELAIIKSEKIRLTNMGYRVTAFTKSNDALDAFKKSPDDYDLILTDYTMPNLTGLVIAKEAHKIRKGIPVIICSGSIEVGKTVEKLENTIFLKKPVLINDLSKTISKLLNKN